MRQFGVKSWTNESVRRFSPKANPVEEIIKMAREVVLRARDEGWQGPPFNPIALAEVLGIPVEASAAVPDARTVVDERGTRIEYNPQQRRARARFSIAHEIVHTFFPDYGEAVRHRGGNKTISDDWQLELLCNIGAAEMVMRIGSLPKLTEVPPLEALLADRMKFDVSVEAYLIRIVSVTAEPVTMFIASAHPSGDAYDYRIDYTAPSETAPLRDLREQLVPEASVVRQCTAIGASARGIESWWQNSDALIECVGIPGYPGTALPRVAGLIRHNERRLSDFVHFIHGDILSPRDISPILVCQLVNDRAIRWGGGVARQMARRHPNAEAEFGDWIKTLPRPERLGKVHFALTKGDIVLASLVAQEGYGQGASRIRYQALNDCLHSVAEYARRHDCSVHMPRIGTGGAGADWEIVESLIRQNFEGLAKGVWIYDLPPKQTQQDMGF